MYNYSVISLVNDMNNRTKTNIGDGVYKHRDDLITSQRKSYRSKSVVIRNGAIQNCFYPIESKIGRKDSKYWVLNHANKLTISNNLFNSIVSGREDVHHLSRVLMDIYKWASKIGCNKAHIRIKNVVSDSSTRYCCSTITGKLMTSQELVMDWFLYGEWKTIQAATGMMLGIYDSCLDYIVKSNRFYDERVSRVGKLVIMKKNYVEGILHSTDDGCVYILILNRMKVMEVTGGLGKSLSTLLVSNNVQDHTNCLPSLPLDMYNLSLLPVMNGLRKEMVWKEAYRLNNIVQTVMRVFYSSNGNIPYNVGSLNEYKRDLIDIESTEQKSLRSGSYVELPLSGNPNMLHNEVATGVDCVGLCKFQYPIRRVWVVLIEYYVAKTNMDSQVACMYKYDETLISLSSATKLAVQGDTCDDEWAYARINSFTQKETLERGADLGRFGIGVPFLTVF